MPGPVEAPTTVMQQVSSVLEKSIVKNVDNTQEFKSDNAAKTYCQRKSQ